ncbi:hypothetical protein ACFYRJ_38505 [Streptomyces sp. NPDC005531]|uniref:hypothetical protein n=1 Tax=Streptomyces sp. NPDC005531 TaxID=3364722 RepID=UPI0036ABF3BB
MSVGERVGLYGAHIVVTVTVVSQAVSTALHGSQPVAALYASVIAGGVWAWYGHRTHDRGVWAGAMVQTMTWDCYVRPHTPPRDDALYTVLAQRMRQTDQYVRAFAAEHGLERISVALPLERGAFDDACSTRHGRRGHVWLWTRWFHPRDTRHLPAVLEHELAHVRRSDPRKRLIAETTAVATTAFAAGMLPLPAFALTALTAWLQSEPSAGGANSPAMPMPFAPAAALSSSACGAPISPKRAPCPGGSGSGTPSAPCACTRRCTCADGSPAAHRCRSPHPATR